MIRNLPYDPLRDMAGIGSIYQIPTVVLASKTFPADSCAEFLSVVKDNPNRYAYAYSHATGAAVGASVALAANLKMNVVPYSSGPQAINDLLGGHVPVMFTDIAAALPLLQAEQLKVFAISSPQRSKLLPDLPTFTEVLPVPVEFVGWGGFVAPAKTPKHIVETLNIEMNKTLATEDAARFLNTLGAEVMTGTPGAFDAFIRKEAPLWVAALKAANIGPQ
jgi:tripartite-type tricarboxylate transporter receptor subunit TctC